MCLVLNITRQNYYKYRNTIDKDYYDYLEIKRVFEEGSELYGARRIKSALLRDTGWIVNLKKIRRIMKKYDSYIDTINEVITSFGYSPIPKRADYMRHFEELSDTFSQLGIPFNLNDMKSQDLPTDINGLTEFNKPGRTYFSATQQRYGIKTNYDAITGIDKYIEEAGNYIFHTMDIQNYRAFSQFVRDTYGMEKGFENAEKLTDEEYMQRVEEIQSNNVYNSRS